MPEQYDENPDVNWAPESVDEDDEGCEGFDEDDD